MSELLPRAHGRQKEHRFFIFSLSICPLGMTDAVRTKGFRTARIDYYASVLVYQSLHLYARPPSPDLLHKERERERETSEIRGEVVFLHTCIPAYAISYIIRRIVI